MSKHRNADVRSLLRSLHGLTPDEIRDQVGIDIQPDGTVYDEYDEVHYDSLDHWAESQAGKQNQKIFHHLDWD